MSRWNEYYATHPFQAVWSNLKTNLDATRPDDETIITSVKEIARLKKVIAFVDGILNSIDPELTPPSTWDNFNSQATSCNQQVTHFNSNRNIAHITNANNHADNLLTYVRPYMVTGGKIGKALQESAKQYSRTIDECLDSFQKKASELLEALSDDTLKAHTLHENMASTYEQVDQLKAELFGNEAKSDGTKSKIEQLVETIEDRLNEVNQLHTEALVGDAHTPSTKSAIATAKERAIEDQASIESALASVSDEVRALDAFHTKIFGKFDAAGEREGGLAEELDKRVKALGHLE